MSFSRIHRDRQAERNAIVQDILRRQRLHMEGNREALARAVERTRRSALGEYCERLLSLRDG